MSHRKIVVRRCVGVRVRVFGCFDCCLACLSSDGMQCDMQFSLADKVKWISIKKNKKKTEDVVPDDFNIQGAFLVLHFRHTAEGFQ